MDWEEYKKKIDNFVNAHKKYSKNNIIVELYHARSGKNYWKNRYYNFKKHYKKHKNKFWDLTKEMLENFRQIEKDK